MGYSRTPNVAVKCDLVSCGRQQRKLVTLVYIFPQWLLKRALSIMFCYSRSGGVAASLRTLRPRSESDMVWVYIDNGDVGRLKALFDRGEASPFDVTGTNQVGPLQVCTSAVRRSHY